MPTPILHSAAALAVSRLLPPSARTPRAAALLVLASNVPDLDLVPCFFRWDLIRYHHQFTHSLVFAAASALGFSWLAGRRFFPAFLAVCASHPLLDVGNYDKFHVVNVPIVGIPLAWPFDGRHWDSLLNLVPKVSFGMDLRIWVSPTNLWTFGYEAALGLGLIALAEGGRRAWSRLRPKAAHGLSGELNR